MKKLSKFLALCLAMALVFGMTVSAETPSDGDVNPPADDGGNGSGSEDSTPTPGAGCVTPITAAAASLAADESISAPAGVTVTISEPTKEQFDNVLEKSASSLVASSIKTRYGVTVKNVVFVFDIKASSAATMSFKVPYVEEGRHYALLHMTDAGELLEVLPAKCNADGWITASFSSYSVYAVVETDAEVAAGQAAAATSPKTGESLPVAGVAAMILLAGAFVCARRVRFQR